MVLLCPNGRARHILLFRYVSVQRPPDTRRVSISAADLMTQLAAAKA